MDITPFKPIEKTVRALIEAKHPDTVGRTGGDLSYTPDQPFYVFISGVPGGATADELTGTWAVDIEVFDTSWTQAVNRLLAIEATLVGVRGFRHDGQQIDRVFINTSAGDRPWDDDTVHRIGGTYVFSARRSA